MKEYLKAQNKMNLTILGSEYSADELDRLSKSDYRWADNRTKPFSHKAIKKGEIYQFEFGKNYIPEMSYEHRGLVIGIKQKLLYVLPIFSYDPHKHHDVYHPIDYLNSKSDMFLLKKGEFLFITHDSILKLNDIRTVSVNRILYQQNGRISPLSDTYKLIEQLVLQKYFPNFYYDFEQNLKIIEALSENLKVAVKNNHALEAKNELLNIEIKNLQNSPIKL